MKNTRKYQGGYIMILNTLLFIGIITVMLAALSNIIVVRYTSAQGYTYSKQAYLTAHSATEEAIYRLKNNISLGNSVTVTLGSSSATITKTTAGNSTSVSVDGQDSGYERTLKADMSMGTGVAFHYGIQAGDGGFVLNGGSKVIGNVYSNSDIIATNGVTITGSAIAANSSAMVADQVNDSPTTPPNTIKFRDTSTTQDVAQSFMLSASSPINKISIFVKKFGAPSDANVRIVTDNSGSPSTSNVLSSNGTLSAGLVGTSAFGWIDVVFPDNPILTPGTKYWVVIDSSSNNTSNYFILGANSAYASGSAKIGKYSSTWTNTTPSGLDLYFRIYLGGITSTLGGDGYVGGVVVGSAGVGDAWAHDVQGASVAGALYCQTGSNNNKSCNTSRADPAPQPYPISDANVQDWKNSATTGTTTTGNYHVDYHNATLGPAVITGNLLVDGGGTLTVTGTIWVKGTFTVTGGGKVKVSSSLGSNSGVIISDGIVSLGGGGDLSGSGQSGSYLLVLTTSNCPMGPSCGGSDAMTLSGGAGAVILNAQNGNMVLNGGSGVHEATAYKIIASGGATITYDSGLANMNFSSGPGGGYQLLDWLEI